MSREMLPGCEDSAFGDAVYLRLRAMDSADRRNTWSFGWWNGAMVGGQWPVAEMPMPMRPAATPWALCHPVAHAGSCHLRL
jgi:hypothetical protein